VLDEIGVVGMIVDHAHDVGGHLAGSPSSEQIEQAVRLLARHDGDPRLDIGEAQVDRHAESSGDRGETIEDLRALDAETLEFEFDALEENLLDVVGVLLGVHDVPVVGSDELGHRGDDTTLVGAGEQEHTVSRHPESLLGRERFPTLDSPVDDPAGRLVA